MPGLTDGQEFGAFCYEYSDTIGGDNVWYFGEVLNDPYNNGPLPGGEGWVAGDYLQAGNDPVPGTPGPGCGCGRRCSVIVVPVAPPGQAGAPGPVQRRAVTRN